MSSAPEEDVARLSLQTEQLSVARARRTGATVRVSTVTHEHQHLVTEELAREQVEVTRVAIDRRVESVPPIRTEGDTTIVPVVEEIVVVERHLILKEEVRIRRVSLTETHRETVVLRDQEAVITRIQDPQEPKDKN